MKATIRLIDIIRGTGILKKYDELVASVNHGALSGMTVNKRIADLLANLREYNAYYKPLLIKYSLEQINDNPMKVLSSMPIVDKQLINDNYQNIFTPIKGRTTQKKKTGGSTGNPFYYHVDKEHLSWFWGYIYFFWNRYSGYQPGDPFITIAGNSLRTTNRRIAEKVYHKLQHNYFIKGDIIDADMVIDFSKTDKAILLYGYPSSIMNLLRVKPDLANHVHKLKAIFTTSEQLTIQARNFIEDAFNLPVFDMYGANDGGILTCECPQHDGYHINMHNCYVESFQNEFGMSELLLTNLNSYSFPMVRYRVGDLGKVDDKSCSCGLNWPKITELKGRTRDLIKLPNGASVHGSFFNNVLYKYPIVDGYKIIQQKDLTLRLFLHLNEPEKYSEVSRMIVSEIHSTFNDLQITTEIMSERNPTNDKFKLIESHAI